jgi:hypothetical protein
LSDDAKAAPAAARPTALAALIRAWTTVTTRLRALSGAVGEQRLARVLDALTLLAIVVFHHVLAAKSLRAPFGFDERYFLHQGWSVTKGMVPYRDFQEFKPPMIFFVNALGIGLFGLEGLAYRHILSLLSLAGFLALAVALLSRRTSRLLVVALVVLLIDHFFDRTFHDSSINSAETLSLDFFAIGCGILLTRTRWERTRDVAGAAFLALSPLSKEPLVFAAALAWVSVVLLRRSEATRPDAVKRFVVVTLASIAGVALVWLTYMLATRSLGWYLVQLKLNIAYTKNYARQLNWFPKAPPGGLLAEYGRRLQASYVNGPHLGAFLPFFAATVCLGTRSRRVAGAAALATAGAALYAVTIGNGFAPHYFIMAMTGTFLCAVVGAMALDAIATETSPGLRRWLGVAWMAIAVVTAFPRFSDEWGKSYQPPTPPVSRADVDLVRAHSAPTDKIWTLGDPLLYVYADRLNACREGIVIDELIPYHPGNSDEERLSGQRAELLASRPKLVIFGEDPVSYQRKQRTINALVMPFLRDAGYVKLSDKLYARP